MSEIIIFDFNLARHDLSLLHRSKLTKSEFAHTTDFAIHYYDLIRDDDNMHPIHNPLIYV